VAPAPLEGRLSSFRTGKDASEAERGEKIARERHFRKGAAFE
jgi:hypothetical protein